MTLGRTWILAVKFKSAELYNVAMNKIYWFLFESESQTGQILAFLQLAYAYNGESLLAAVARVVFIAYAADDYDNGWTTPELTKLPAEMRATLVREIKKR